MENLNSKPMKKTLIALLFTLSTSSLFAQELSAEQQAAKQVVTDAYVEGIQNGGSIEAIRKGFHPSFNMLRFMNNEVKPLPIEEWITNIEKYRAEKPDPNPVRTEAKFVSVDVTGNTAVVKVELTKEGKLIFTDYLTLFKFTEGWRIVSKVYHRH